VPCHARFLEKILPDLKGGVEIIFKTRRALATLLDKRHGITLAR
jgi:hypothetical protein